MAIVKHFRVKMRLASEANYSRGKHQTRGGKTNFQITRLKISWPTVTVYLAPHIKQERSVQTLQGFR